MVDITPRTTASQCGRDTRLMNGRYQLCYLYFGVASFLVHLLTGHVLDWNFQLVALGGGIIVDRKRTRSLAAFLIDKTRLILALPMAALGVLALLCYGWVLEIQGPLASALVLQFVSGLVVIGVS